MPAMNYSEATGVRARSDLSANAKPNAPAARLTQAEVIKGAHWLTEELRKAEAHDQKYVSIPVPYTRRLVDLMLEIEQQLGERP